MRALLLAQKSLYADIILQRFCKLEQVEIVGLIYSDTFFTGKSKVESLLFALKKCGVRVLFWKWIDMIFARAPKRSYPFPVMHAQDINSRQWIEKITEMNPEIIFSVYFNQVLRDEVLTIPPCGAVNVHPAYLPQYRGVGPTFWVLANGEKETGVTYHWITPKVDGGGIIQRDKVPIEPQDTVHSLYRKCSIVAAQVLPDIIGAILGGDICSIAQDDAESTYYGIPDREGYARFKRHQKRFISWEDIIAKRS